MRRYDVKPGVIYAYKQPVSNEIVPIAFLSNENLIGALRQDARGYGERAFKRPRAGTHKPQAGTVYNDGTIGFPAVRLPAGRIRPGTRDIGKLVTLRDFDNAERPNMGNGCEFFLVTSMARVIGEWED